MAESTGDIRFTRCGIGTALAQNRLVVPPNQREYAWQEEHVRALFQDLSRCIQNKQSSYFLGTIVLTKGKGDTLEVADGQQRLATSTILLAAIRDYFHAQQDNLLREDVEKFLFTTVRKTREIKPRLTLNVDDNAFFDNIILSPPDSPKRKVKAIKKSNERLRAAAEFAAQHVQDIIRPHAEKNRADVLTDWVEFIEKSAQVIMLQVPDDLNAFVMFETLNDRGLRTSQSDLLKNHLFQQAGDRLGEAQQKWTTMSSSLEALGIDDIVLTYLRHLAISLYGHTRDREVYEKIKTATKGVDASIRFLDAIAENANDYVAILSPDQHVKWNKYPQGTRTALKTLAELRVTPLRPLLLSIAQKFTPTEAAKAFSMAIRWAVRFLVVGGLRSGSTEEAIAKWAKRITDGGVTTARQLVDEAKAAVPSDTQFENDFSTARVSKSFLARYYLRAIELHLKSDPQPEWIPNDSFVINLEHVLPENPDKNWPGIAPETHNAYFSRLGNLALLQEKKNSVIANSAFEVKRPILQASTFTTTQMIGREAKWEPDQIDMRQKQLAAWAVKTWPASL